MRLISLLFLLGTVSVQLFTELPGLIWLMLLACTTVFMTIFIRKKSSNLNFILKALAAFSIGLLLAGFSSKSLLDSRLSNDLEGKELLLTGRVLDVPNVAGDGVRFRFRVDHAVLPDTTAYTSVDKAKNFDKVDFKGVIRLGWFQGQQIINAGENWQLLVRLKRPSGFMNPGGFDYEKWLFTERILATGYIRKSEHLNKRLAEAPWWSINYWRQLIHEKIQSNVINKSSAAVLSALTVAVRNSLDDQQWQLLQQTGTSHLVAISGLHIAVVAGFAFFPVMLIWRLFPGLNEKVPLRIMGGVLGVLFALVYAMLAGFTLPTQRALLMVVIGMWGLVSRRNYDASTILALALIGVLLIDPLAAMTISFWLSFLAVALILIFLKRQIQKPRFAIIKLQLLLSLAMLPLTLLFFGTASLTSPVANLFAIPWVSLVVVPLSLIALILMPFSAVLSDQLFSIAAMAIDYLFKGLAYLAESPLANLHPAEIPATYLVAAFTGLLFLLLPKGFPARWLGLVLIVPAFLFNPEKPQQDSFSYTLLDVGQGMASVVQTAEHTLVYDTGTRVSDSFDVGKLVLVPYLRAKGIREVDSLIVSHEDNDHRGGARYLVDTLEVNTILSSDTTILSGNQVEACVKGMQWQWDGVDFEILSPPELHSESYPESDNNRSCVLRVSNQHHSLLLTADIQRISEEKLIENYPDKLASEVVTVPHHGSKTSSSIEFIESVSPKVGLIPAGYRSRFGHPKPEIIERYETAGVKLLDTVNDGAIRLDFPVDATALKIHSYRKQNSGFWNR